MDGVQEIVCIAWIFARASLFLWMAVANATSLSNVFLKWLLTLVLSSLGPRLVLSGDR